MIAILTVMRWNLSVVLICFSFTGRDSQHFFMCFLAIWTFSFCKSSVALFFIGSLIWGGFNFLSSLYILVISPLSDVQIANNFYHSVGGLFNLETISFVVQKVFSSCSPICPSFVLVAGLMVFY
jgi:hypothetical protein